MYFKLDEEHYVENNFLLGLKKLGWRIYRQSKHDPEKVEEIIGFDEYLEPSYGKSLKFRENFESFILEEEFKESIRRINPWIEEDQINEVLRRITVLSSNSLLKANFEVHTLLLENTSVLENRKTGERSPTVKYIDFQNPENNSFVAISQFKITVPGTKKYIIPDIVLFVNGLPLVVVECKSPSISDPIGEAVNQLMRYCNRRGAKEGNEKLFWYNLFMVATSNQVAKYGTITSEYEHFVEWKDPYPYSISDIGKENVTSQDVLIWGMLSKRNLLDILHTFTIFKEDPKTGIIKVVPRYQQFRAVKKIVKKIKEGKTPEERGGIIWHTQGSGKSLTMMYTVREVYHDPELSNFKIVFVTDRKDLEKQLYETSKGVGFTVNLADSIKKLQELLKTNTPDLVMGMIHKYQERELKEEFPLLNTSSSILIMIDEAHRTQYKLLGANLRKALPNAVKIAFTGTPIEKTELTFGEYIDRYSIKQAVEDGVTLEIIYEGRVHSAELSDEKGANEKFEEVFSKVDPEEKARIMGKYTWRGYLEAEEVIKDKAKDMINHYVTHVLPNGFKAQVVTVSRLAAIRYKKALEEALKEKVKELKNSDPDNVNISLLERLKVGVVISRLPNDPQEYYQYTDENEHERIIRSFKLPFDKTDENGISGEVGILVVQNMLITGFDAPIEQVMYLDNVLKEHNLLQAIARVNRVYKNKSCGFVVDYVGVLKHLREALAIYADEDIDEITQVVKNKAKSIDELGYTCNLINEFFKKYGIKDWRNNVDECIDLLVDEVIRKEFVTLVRRLYRAIDSVLPDPVSLKYIDDLKILSFIKLSARNRYRDDKLSITDASAKVREIIEKFLVSKGVDPKVPPTPLFDDKFTEGLKNKSHRAKAEELRYAIVEHIEKHFDEDPEFYERFSDRLKKVLEEYKDNWEIIAKELEKVREEMKKGRGEEIFGLDPKKEMPFFGVLKLEIFGKKPIEEMEEEEKNFLVNLTKDIVEIIEREVKKVDFWESSSKQKVLKSYIASHLLSVDKFRDKFLERDVRSRILERLLEVAYRNMYV